MCLFYLNCNSKKQIRRTSSSTSFYGYSKDIVYYNPKNPNDCLTKFDAEMSSFEYFFIIIPIIFIIIAIFIMYRKLKNCNYDDKVDNEINNTSNFIALVSNDFYSYPIILHNKNNNNNVYNYPISTNLNNPNSNN